MSRTCPVLYSLLALREATRPPSTESGCEMARLPEGRLPADQTASRLLLAVMFAVAPVGQSGAVWARNPPASNCSACATRNGSGDSFSVQTTHK